MAPDGYATYKKRDDLILQRPLSQRKKTITQFGGIGPNEEKRSRYTGEGGTHFWVLEVLDKGSVGTSYKAVLEESTLVEKRLKDVTGTKKEFEAQMEVMGKINNENVVPFRVYYFSKDGKLFVSDFMVAAPWGLIRVSAEFRTGTNRRISLLDFRGFESAFESRISLIVDFSPHGS